MTEPWFNPNLYAWIPGTLVGVAGGIEGVLVGLLASKGKHRTFVMTVHFAVLLGCGALLVTGAAALLMGQPYGIWYGFGLPGLLGLIIFGSFTGMIRKRYTETELRKSMGEDL
jgi:zinc transporter ZupT